MTHIETDNPLIQFRIWEYDFIAQYWYIALLVVLLYVFMEYHRQHVREKRKKREQEELNAYRKRMERHQDWYESDHAYRRRMRRLEKDVIELDMNDVKPIEPMSDERR